jgi:DeoR/GlpR family transcriptional regulator of sugar metabolism
MDALAIERQDRIRSRLRTHPVARVDALSVWLKVSAATVRRDLLDLEQRGWVRRVHGGAVAVEGSLDEPLFDDKTGAAAREKQAIARSAAGFVGPHDTVYLDGGSTVLALARILQPLTRLTVVTNSLRIAHLYGGNGPRMILVGGDCRRLSQTTVGPLTRTILGQVCLDIAFMGAVGASAADGLLTTNPDEAFTKELAIARGRKVVLLADASKFGKASFVRFGVVSDLDMLITDASAPAHHLDAFRKAGVDVVQV